MAVSVFPDELYPAPRSWAEKAYPKLIHYNKLDKGGHFAAWEQPQAFVTRGAHRVPVASLMVLQPAAHASAAPPVRRRSLSRIRKHRGPLPGS